MTTINTLREIIQTRKMQKLDGIVIDVPCANAIVYTYDQMNLANKAKFVTLPLNKMLAIAKQIVR